MMKTMIKKHRVARRCFSTGLVAAAYELKVDAGEVRRDDEAAGQDARRARGAPAAARGHQCREVASSLPRRRRPTPLPSVGARRCERPCQGRARARNACFTRFAFPPGSSGVLGALPEPARKSRMLPSSIGNLHQSTGPSAPITSRGVRKE